MATAFGLDITDRLPVSLLSGTRAGATGRALELRWEERRDVGARPEPARAICARDGADGEPEFEIAGDPHDGYRVWGRGRGCYRLTANGSEVIVSGEDASRAGRERFLVGQVLPFAALLAGLEVFHASAVALEQRAVAFVGPSGAGKTSIALELCRRGARFLADDVLALEVRDGRVQAHPGTPVAGVSHAEAERLARAGRPLTHELAHDSRERLLEVDGADGPAALEALFFLERVPVHTPRVRFAPVGDALTLLAATFNFVLDTPARTQRLLDVCAHVSRRPVERLVVGPSVGPEALADAVLERLHAPAADS